MNGSTGGTGGGGDGKRLASKAKRVHPVNNIIMNTSSLFILSNFHQKTKTFGESCIYPITVKIDKGSANI